MSGHVAAFGRIHTTADSGDIAAVHVASQGHGDRSQSESAADLSFGQTGRFPSINHRFVLNAIH